MCCPFCGKLDCLEHDPDMQRLDPVPLWLWLMLIMAGVALGMLVWDWLG